MWMVRILRREKGTDIGFLGFIVFPPCSKVIPGYRGQMLFKEGKLLQWEEKKKIFSQFMRSSCKLHAMTRISYPISSRGSVVSVWLCEMYHLHKLRCKMGTLYILQILMHCTFSILVGGSTKNVWGFEHFFLNSVQEEVYHFTWS